MKQQDHGIAFAPSTQETAIANGSKALHPGVIDGVLRMLDDIRFHGPPRVALQRAIYFTESSDMTEVHFSQTPLIPGMSDDEEHTRTFLSFITPHKSVNDHELPQYVGNRENKYGVLGRVYELKDFTPPAPKRLHRSKTIIDEVFGPRESGTH